MDLDLLRPISDAVNRHWAAEVQILGAWPDAPAAVCLVYRRTIDPGTIIGRRVEFHDNPEDGTGTVEGFARAVALELAEPLGATVFTSRPDDHGIVWVAVPEGHPMPQPPVDVIRILAAR